MSDIMSERERRLAEVAAMFEDATPFDGLDLDAFVPGLHGAASADAPAPQPPKPEVESSLWSRRDKGAFPALDWLIYCRSAPYPAKDWRRWKYLAHLDQSDTDNATRLLSHFGRDLLVRRQEGGKEPAYVAWAGTHWDAVTGRFGAMLIAQQVGDRIKQESAFIGPTADEKAKLDAYEAIKAQPAADQEATMIAKAAEKVMDAIAKRKKARREFGISCKNGARLREMLAQASPKLLTDPDAFNADPLKVATPTQTITWVREIDLECPDPDVTRMNVELSVRLGHDRRDRITRVLPFSYDPKAECPIFMAFINRFQPVASSRRFLQVATGVGLLGSAPQVLVFHYGEGANGKSVYLEVITRVLAELAGSLPSEALTGDEQQGGGLKPSPEIARLDGKRFVRVSEIKEGVPLQEAFVKKLTGSERFPARNLFEGYYDFKPQFIAHMSGNGYPKISGTDNGIWRRMAVLKWPVTLALEEQRLFNEVVDEMVAEGPGILRWLIEGATIFLREGLQMPPEVVAETGEMRDRMDPVRRFYEACIIVTDDSMDIVTGGNLYKAYHEWADASGDHNPVSITRFGRDIVKHKGIVKNKTGAIVQYRGIQLRQEPRSPADRWDDDPNYR